CNWLALSREAPAAQRNLARSNLRFYVESAAAVMPSFAAHRVGFTAPDGYHPSNPTVACLAGEIVLAQRAVNVLLTEDGQYRTADGASERSRNFLLKLNHDLQTRSSAEILSPADLP